MDADVTTDPAHLKAQAGDKRSLCGIKKPLPYSLVKWAPDHRYPHERCALCYVKAGLSALLNGTPMVDDA
jgi:hypothetical protein